jgi:hypothetical protein
MRVFDVVPAVLLASLFGSDVRGVNGFALKAEDGTYVPLDWRVKEKRGLTRGSITKVPLSLNSDGTYSAIVNMGTPFQDVPFAISLSENYIAVAGRPDVVTPGPGQVAFYNPTTSTSFVNDTTSPPVQITARYGGSDGVQAQFAKESCKTSDFPYNASIAITPVNATGTLYPPGTAGILGYGVNPVKTAPADATLLGVYLPANFTVAECGFQLNRQGDAQGGLFTMGGRDTNGFTGDFTQLVVPGAGDHPSWSIPLDALKLTTSNTTTPLKGALASIDPLYQDITISSPDAAAFYSKVPGAHATDSTNTRYFVPCDAVIRLSLTFGGREFVMDPRDGVVQEGPFCYGGIRGGGDDLMKVGANFLRNVYTIFGATISNGTPTFTVGFANRVGTQAPPPIQSGNPTGAPGGIPTIFQPPQQDPTPEPLPTPSFSAARTTFTPPASTWALSLIWTALGLGIGVFSLM